MAMFPLTTHELNTVSLFSAKSLLLNYHYWTVLYILSLTSNAAATITTPNLLCFDDSWNIIKGQWEFDTNTCSLQNTAVADENIVWFGSLDGTAPDYRYDFDTFAITAVIEIESESGDAGIIFRTAQSLGNLDEGPSYYVGLYPLYDRVVFGELNNGWFNHTQSVMTIDAHISYTLTVTASNSIYNVYVNDGTAISTLNQSVLTQGSIGIRTAWAPTTFHSLIYEAYIQLESCNTNNYYIRYTDAHLEMNADDLSPEFSENSTFILRIPGLVNDIDYITLQPINVEEYFLRHENKELFIHPYDDTALFKNDTSFKIVLALNGDPDCISLQSFNYANYFIRDSHPLMTIDTFVDNTTYKNDASFRIPNFNLPTSAPTSTPTKDPSYSTADPTLDPTHPTMHPTRNPSVEPTRDPTIDPTMNPTRDPTTDPSRNPTLDPTRDPTIDPTQHPTTEPTREPTMIPTRNPTQCVDYYNYTSLDGVDIMYPYQVQHINDLNITNDDDVQQYTSIPGVVTFFEEEIYCNNTDAYMCLITCNYPADCAYAIVSSVLNTKLDEIRLVCAVKKSCLSLTLNITQSSIKQIYVLCDATLSCEGVHISINNILDDTDIALHCSESFSCKGMRIDLIITDAHLKLNANVSCYKDYACDNMIINTAHSKNIFIGLHAYRYSRDIEIIQMFWKNVEVNCGVDLDHRYIRYETNDLLDPVELLQYARNEYETTRLPCEDIHILCSNNSDFNRECSFQYELSNTISLVNILNNTDRANCYWLDMIQLYNAHCDGSCEDTMDYYVHNLLLRLELKLSSENEENWKRRLVLMNDSNDINTTTELYQICNEHFGCINDTENTLSSVDAIFYAVLNIIRSASGDNGILHKVLQFPQTELIQNISFIECDNDGNIIQIKTNVTIDSIENDPTIIDALFDDGSEFIQLSEDLLSKLFNFPITLKHETIMLNEMHIGVDKRIVVWIVSVCVLIIAVIIFVVVKIYQREKEKIEALTMYIKNPMVLMIGIGAYDKNPVAPAVDGYFANLSGIEADIEHVNTLFRDELNYTVYPTQNESILKQEWKSAEVMEFLEEKADELENNIDDTNGGYDGLVVLLSCHGIKDHVITSDYQKIEKVAVHRVFSAKHPTVRRIPRMFIYDCCDGEDERERGFRTDSIYQTLEEEEDINDIAHNTDEQNKNINVSIEMATFAPENTIRVKTVTGAVPAWLRDEDNPDYRLVTIHASNEGFQSKMDIKTGSYVITNFIQQLRSNIFEHKNEKFLFEICDDIQRELHENGKQHTVNTFNDNMRYIKFLNNSHVEALVEVAQ